MIEYFVKRDASHDVGQQIAKTGIEIIADDVEKKLHPDSTAEPVEYQKPTLNRKR